MADTKRLEAAVIARGSAQKHVWRARIILLTAQGLGTQAIMAATGKSKPCVWRWQERFMAEAFDGLLRDKTQHSRTTACRTYGNCMPRIMASIPCFCFPI